MTPLHKILLITLIAFIASCGSEKENSSRKLELTPPVIELAATLSFFERESIHINANVSSNNGGITYSWLQIKGQQVEFETDKHTLSFTTFDVIESEEVLFELTVSDSNELSSKKQIAINILPIDLEDIKHSFLDSRMQECIDNIIHQNERITIPQLTEFKCKRKESYTDTKSFFTYIQNTDGLEKLSNLKHLTLDLNNTWGEATVDVNVSNDANIIELNIIGNIGKLELENQDKLSILNLSGYQIQDLNFGKSTSLKSMSIYTETFVDIEFPLLEQLNTLRTNRTELFDSVHKASLKELTLDNLNTIDLSELRSLNSITLNEFRGSSLSFIENNILSEISITQAYNLTELLIKPSIPMKNLSMHWSQIDNLDFADLEQLKTLSLDYNYKLVNISFPTQSNLTSLTFHNNNLLETLNIKEQTKLIDAFISNNQLLKKIEFPINSKIQELHLMNNQIPTINIDNLSELKFLDISGNPLTEETKVYLKSKITENLTIIF